MLRAFPNEDGGALVHLQNVSGGVLAGDRMETEIEVGAGAIAQVTTTGATRLYRHRAGAADSEQQVRIHVGEGACLEYLPDMTIPFRGSRHRQSTTAKLEAGALLFWWETLAPGRQAMGERFAYERLQIRNEVRTAQRPLLLEEMLLEPARREMSSEARMGPYTHAASFYAMRVGEPAARWLELEAELNRYCAERSGVGDIIAGSSTLAAEGIAVRAMSVSALPLPALLAHVWRISKRFLTGRDAVLPRKVY
ncbi:MAG: urease accessory protein UreD [Candidatus Solibacter sp.]